MAKELRKLAVCLNCERSIEGENFCPSCGQENTDQIVSTRHLLRDVVDEFLKFDSKLFITVKMLLLKPGRLTQDYLEGKRARYITPLRLYFTISALFFLVYSWSGWDQQIQKIAAQQQNSLSTIGSVDQAVSSIHVKEVEPISSSDPQAAKKRTASRRVQQFARQVVAIQKYLLNNLSLLKFFFIPLTALVMQALYLRTRRLYVEHLVFAAHVNSFSYLVAIPSMCLRSFLAYNVISALAAPIYTFFAMRVVYPQPVWKMLVKCVLISVVPTLLFILLFILVSVCLLAFSLLAHSG